MQSRALAGRPVVGRLLSLAGRLMVTGCGIVLVTFVLSELAPGDAVLARGGARIDAAAQAAERHALGLDRPFAVRLVGWSVRCLALDLGHSFVDGREVRHKIGEALPTSLLLTVFALLLAYATGIPLGVAMAAHAERRWVRWLERAQAIVYAVPLAALALLLLRAGVGYGRNASALAAAALCLASPLAVRVARVQAAALVAVLAAPPCLTASAFGASPLRVLLRHALPAALPPTVALAGADLPSLLSGGILVEQVFGLPGLGTLALDSALARDQPTLLGLALVSALAVLVGVTLSDRLARHLDPRMRGA